MKIYWCSEGYHRINETCQTKEEMNCKITESGDCIECEAHRELIIKGLEKQ